LILIGICFFDAPRFSHQRSAVGDQESGRILLALAASPARAFDLDPGPGMHCQASFRGDEIGVREHAYGTDDFLTIFSYFHPLEDRLLYERAPVALRGTVGSVATDAFYLDIAGRLGFTFWDRVTVRYRIVQDEDFDSSYLRRHRD
jgi:hypothetical protein